MRFSNSQDAHHAAHAMPARERESTILASTALSAREFRRSTTDACAAMRMCNHMRLHASAHAGRARGRAPGRCHRAASPPSARQPRPEACPPSRPQPHPADGPSAPQQQRLRAAATSRARQRECARAARGVRLAACAAKPQDDNSESAGRAGAGACPTRRARALQLARCRSHPSCPCRKTWLPKWLQESEVGCGRERKARHHDAQKAMPRHPKGTCRLASKGQAGRARETAQGSAFDRMAALLPSVAAVRRLFKHGTACAVPQLKAGKKDAPLANEDCRGVHQ